MSTTQCRWCGTEFTYPSRIPRTYCGQACSRAHLKDVNHRGVQNLDAFNDSYAERMHMRRLAALEYLRGTR